MYIRRNSAGAQQRLTRGAVSLEFIDTLLQFAKFFLSSSYILMCHLSEIIQSYGVWTYLILFLIIFCETGLVVTPFLPVTPFFSRQAPCRARGDFSVMWLCMILLSIAAVLGDTVNYWIGSFVGPKIFHKEHVRFLNKEYLDRTHQFYEKYGGKTIIIARFVPIIRTFAPFVAGIGSMTYWHFISYNVIGGVVWIAAFVLAGYYFGNIPMVKNNFTMVIFAIIIISILPGVIEFIRQHRMHKKK